MSGHVIPWTGIGTAHKFEGSRHEIVCVSLGAAVQSMMVVRNMRLGCEVALCASA